MATMPARRLQPDPRATTLHEADLPGLHLRHRGTVRDVFDLPCGAADQKILWVATNRLSAFHVTLPDPSPAKGPKLIQWQRPFPRPIFQASTCATAARSAMCSTCRAATPTRNC